MSRTGNNIASAVFVLLLALFVSQPILNASDSGPPADGGNGAEVTTTTHPEPEPTEEPATTTLAPATTVPEEVTTTTEPGPEESPTGGGTVAETGVLLADYPLACNVKVNRQSPGLLAAVNGTGISVSGPGSGTLSTREGVRGPIQWSPSGRFLGIEDGKILTSTLKKRTDLFSGPSHKWAWSPTSDCAAGIVDGGLEVRGIGVPPVKIVDLPVTDFAFSPSGGKLVMAADDPAVAGRSLWVARLKTGEVKQVVTTEDSSEIVVFGWSGNGESYVWSQAGELHVNGKAFPGVVQGFKDQFASCPQAIVAVSVGADSASRLYNLDTRGSPASPRDRETVRGACSPEGGFIAEVGGPARSHAKGRRLFLADSDGSFVQDLTADSSFADEYPLWGPVGTGVAFIRRPLGGGAPQVWYLPEGGTGTYAGFTVKDLKAQVGHFAWSSVFDWSADRPTGTPPDRS